MYSLPENIEIEIILEHSHILKRSDGIVEIRCADDFTYELSHILENHDCIKKFAITEKVLVLNFAGHYTSVSNEARNYVARGEHKSFIAAEAFLIHGLPQRLLANFFISINKPVVSAAFFNYKDKSLAEKWLFEHRENI